LHVPVVSRITAAKRRCNHVHLAAALVLASVSGTAAQSYDPSVGSGNIAPSPYARRELPTDATRGALGAYARVRDVGADDLIRRSGVSNPDANYWYERNREEFRGRW
jgi:hypothetical protein